MLMLLSEHLTRYLLRLQRLQLSDHARDFGCADGARAVFCHGSVSDSAAHREPHRSADPRARPRESSAEGRHADDGWRADLARDRDQHAAMGESQQPFRLDRAVDNVGLRCRSVSSTTIKKLVVRNSKGLQRQDEDVFWQSRRSALAAAIALYVTAENPAVEHALLIPYFKDADDSARRCELRRCSPPLIVVAARTRVNLTDGLDGLAIMPAVLVGGSARRLCLRGRQRHLRVLPRHPVCRGCRGDVGFLCGPRWRRLGLLVVQHLSRAGLHGRHRCACTRCGSGACSGGGAARTGVIHYGRCFRRRNRLSHYPGCLLQDDRPAHFSHGAAAPSLRAQGLGRAESDRSFLDHHGHFRVGRAWRA